ncbi:hypothetical protein ACJX0J_019371, partial [Zea mays]
MTCLVQHVITDIKITRAPNNSIAMRKIQHLVHILHAINLFNIIFSHLQGKVWHATFYGTMPKDERLFLY